jgi:hypothetical protein
MYHPPTFLTPELLAEVLAEFSWPVAYTIVDDRPDGIEVRLPRCHLYFTEGFESEMNLKFLSESTGLDRSVSISEAIAALRSDTGRRLPPMPALREYFSPGASAEKVRSELHDLCALLQTYLRSSLEGDFEWMTAYQNLHRSGG